jgi:tRNA threonylcarbamoyladenosine biosynthesis protein TsaB
VLLALETAGDCCGCALWAGGRLIDERLLGQREQPGAVLVPVLDAMLRDAGVAREQIEAIALSIGPGSFTGLRVGLATALGLTFADERPVVPVPTLAALALQAQGQGDAEVVVPVLDARKGQIYSGLYDRDAGCRLADRVCDPADWFGELAGRGGRFALLGSGAQRYAAQARAALGGRGELLGPELGGPRPGAVARLGARLLGSGESLPIDAVRLRYLRLPEAQLPAR